MGSWEESGDDLPWASSVAETDNPVIHRIYGPKGKVIRVERERHTVKLGFAAREKE